MRCCANRAISALTQIHRPNLTRLQVVILVPRSLYTSLLPWLKCAGLSLLPFNLITRSISECLYEFLVSVERLLTKLTGLSEDTVASRVYLVVWQCLLEYLLCWCTRLNACVVHGMVLRLYFLPALNLISATKRNFLGILISFCLQHPQVAVFDPRAGNIWFVRRLIDVSHVHLVIVISPEILLALMSHLCTWRFVRDIVSWLQDVSFRGIHTDGRLLLSTLRHCLELSWLVCYRYLVAEWCSTLRL